MMRVVQFLGAFIVLLVLVVSADAQDYVTIAAQSSLPQILLNSDPTAGYPLSVHTNWDLTGNSGWLYVCMLMTTPMKGTGNNPDTIPPASVQIDNLSIVTATTNCGLATATPISSTRLKNQQSDPGRRMRNGYRTDTVTVRIANYPAALEPDVYTGTITLIANAVY